MSATVCREEAETEGVRRSETAATDANNRRDSPRRVPLLEFGRAEARPSDPPLFLHVYVNAEEFPGRKSALSRLSLYQRERIKVRDWSLRDNHSHNSTPQHPPLLDRGGEEAPHLARPPI